jgi:hypothetical protein
LLFTTRYTPLLYGLVGVLALCTTACGDSSDKASGSAAHSPPTAASQLASTGGSPSGPLTEATSSAAPVVHVNASMDTYPATIHGVDALGAVESYNSPRGMLDSLQEDSSFRVDCYPPPYILDKLSDSGSVHDVGSFFETGGGNGFSVGFSEWPAADQIDAYSNAYYSYLSCIDGTTSQLVSHGALQFIAIEGPVNSIYFSHADSTHAILVACAIPQSDCDAVLDDVAALVSS